MFFQPFFMIFWNFNKILGKKLFFFFEKSFLRDLFYFLEMEVWYLWWHWDYLRCSPGLGEHFQEKESWPIAFPAILKILDFESILVIFHDFSQYFQQMLTSCSTNDDSSNLSWKHVFLRLWGQFNLYLNHIGPTEPKIEVKTFGPNLAQNANSMKNRLHPLKVKSLWV